MFTKFKLIFFIYLVSTQLGYSAEWSGQFGIESRIFTEEAAYSGQEANSSSIFFQPEFYYESATGNDSFTFVPFVRLDQTDNQRSHADIRELTWVNVQDNLEWRVGIRKVFWGVTEAQHLVDIINQTDTVENQDGEDKLGQPMVNLSYITDSGTFDIFALPYFRERTFAGKKGRLRSQPYVDTTTTFYESANKEKNIDYALRWAHSIDEWDIGLSYFNGTSRTPRFVVGVDSSGEAVFNPYYDLIEQVGLDVQATFNSWLWKLETIHVTGIGGTAASNFIALTAGIEYTFYSVIGEATDIGLVIEYLYDDRGMTIANPFQDDIMLGVRFNLNDEQSSEALFGVIKDMESDATLYFIEASRRLSDNFKIAIEARQYTDIPASDILSAYLKDDFIQLELSYYF
ncbi:FIG01201466: hypothetical protein [hydrothermal vent metagenome]|uniref:Uncharacterized protein n=1 Tax=hydrothermal vent metagenome TaxID=652676 RepID=A0A3B0ZNL4_9ZZZZ